MHAVDNLDNLYTILQFSKLLFLSYKPRPNSNGQMDSAVTAVHSY